MKNKKSLFWRALTTGRIQDAEIAHYYLKLIFWYTLIIGILNIIFFFASNWINTIDGFLVIVLGYFIYKYKSRAASTLLTILFFINTVSSFQSGNAFNSAVVVIGMIASVKAAQSTFFLHKNSPQRV